MFHSFGYDIQQLLLRNCNYYVSDIYSTSSTVWCVDIDVITMLTRLIDMDSYGCFTPILLLCKGVPSFVGNVDIPELELYGALRIRVSQIDLLTQFVQLMYQPFNTVFAELHAIFQRAMKFSIDTTSKRLLFVGWISFLFRRKIISLNNSREIDVKFVLASKNEHLFNEALQSDYYPIFVDVYGCFFPEIDILIHTLNNINVGCYDEDNLVVFFAQAASGVEVNMNLLALSSKTKHALASIVSVFQSEYRRAVNDYWNEFFGFSGACDIMFRGGDRYADSALIRDKGDDYPSFEGHDISGILLVHYLIHKHFKDSRIDYMLLKDLYANYEDDVDYVFRSKDRLYRTQYVFEAAVACAGMIYQDGYLYFRYGQVVEGVRLMWLAHLVENEEFDLYPGQGGDYPRVEHTDERLYADEADCCIDSGCVFCEGNLRQMAILAGDTVGFDNVVNSEVQAIFRYVEAYYIKYYYGDGATDRQYLFRNARIKYNEFGQMLNNNCILDAIFRSISIHVYYKRNSYPSTDEKFSPQANYIWLLLCGRRGERGPFCLIPSDILKHIVGVAFRNPWFRCETKFSFKSSIT